MRFKIDESLPNELVTDIRGLGHEADTVLDERLGGAEDSVVMRAASAEERILLTLDKGIANLQQYPAERHAGVVLFRPDRSGRKFVLDFIEDRLIALQQMDLAGRVTVVGPSRIRVR